MAIQSVEYMQSLVRELAKLPDETEWVEFKCNNKQPQIIGEYISALSNSVALCERPEYSTHSEPHRPTLRATYSII